MTPEAANTVPDHWFDEGKLAGLNGQHSALA
jgi:hypothetical protein